MQLVELPHQKNFIMSLCLETLFNRIVCQSFPEAKQAVSDTDDLGARPMIKSTCNS